MTVRSESRKGQQYGILAFVASCHSLVITRIGNRGFTNE